MKEKIVKLKNGGVFIYSKTKVNNCSAVEVGFRVGAQADKKSGTAHFLEHTLFKKTKNRTNAEVEADRNKITFLNASTSMDY
jgi:predicted Zn-dependent peptidase